MSICGIIQYLSFRGWLISLRITSKGSIHAVACVRIFFLLKAEFIIVFIYHILFIQASLVAKLVENLPAMQETLVRFLGQEDPLEKGQATHSSILSGEFHGQRSLAGHSPWGRKESDRTEQLALCLSIHL